MRTHADQAIAQGNGTTIMGRPCRLERAEAPRTLFVSRYTGQRVSTAEAVQLGSAFGPIQFWWEPTQTERHLHKLPLGVFITFEIYNHFKAAKEALMGHQLYNVSDRQNTKSKSRGRDGAARAAAPVAHAAHAANLAVLSYLPFSIVEQMYMQGMELKRSGMVTGDFSVAVPNFVGRQ